MIGAIYAGLSALLIVGLSLNVIKIRRANRIALSDGNLPELQNAIRAQGNATEYIPISLILLLLLELNAGNGWLLHLGGIALIVGRLIHAKGLLSESIPCRVLGMQCTFFTIIALALANIGYGLHKWFG